MSRYTLMSAMHWFLRCGRGEQFLRRRADIVLSPKVRTTHNADPMVRLVADAYVNRPAAWRDLLASYARWAKGGVRIDA